MNVIVTGATGFLGRSVMRRLEADGVPAVAYSGGINDDGALRRQFDNVHTVIHLAGAERTGRPRLLRQVDIDGTDAVLKAAYYRNVQHLIVVSHLRADPESWYPLLRVKGQVERMVRRSGIPFTIVRCATLFGRDDRFTNTIAALAAWTWPFVWLPGDGNSVAQPLWVDDAARCLAGCVGQPAFYNRTLMVAGAERYRYRELVQRILDAAGLRRRPLYVRLPLVRVAHALIFGWWRTQPANRFFTDRFAKSEIAPLDSVQSTFGFRPARFDYHLGHLRGEALRWRLFVP